jgi:hypothetical protein
MLRTAQSLPRTGLSTLRFDTGRFPPTPAACYRAPWRLPGPDSHRQATTSLRRSATPYGVTSRLLGARKVRASHSRSHTTHSNHRPPTFRTTFGSTPSRHAGPPPSLRRHGSQPLMFRISRLDGMSAPREELHRLIDALPKEAVPVVLAELRIRPAGGNRPWPPRWFAAAEARRPDTSERMDDILHDEVERRGA